MTRPHLVALVVAVASVAGVSLQGRQSPRFRYERPVVTEAPGPHRLAVDAPLLAGAARLSGLQPVDSREGRRWRAHGGLNDFRLFDASGREVPYLLIYPDVGSQQWVTASVQALAATEKTSGFEADLGAPETVDMIHLEGLPGPFLKRLVLEGSGDREHWTVLAGEGTLFDLPDEQLRQRAVHFRVGPYRFLRVTWDDTNSGRMPLPRAVFVRRATPGAPAAPAPTADATFERRPSEPGRSRYRVRLPAAGLPVVALTLDVAGGHVFRTATVSEATLQGTQVAPREIGRATLSRIVRDGLTASALRIPTTPPHEQVIDLVVDDGNNPPLELNRVVLEFAELPWIYFEAPGGALTARYGDPSTPSPRYDLEAARVSIRIGEVPDARWGDPRDTSPPAATADAPAMPDAGAMLEAGAFRYRRDLPAGPPGLVALPLDASVLAHSRGANRLFEDVRVVDESGRQIPYLLERLEEPLSLDLPVQPFEPKAAELRNGGGRNQSTYVVQIPYDNLSNATLVLETSARVFSRRVEAGAERPPDRNRRDTWFEAIAFGSWTHADQGTVAPALSLALGTIRDRQVVVSVDEGDNSPLPITKARLLLPSYRLRFFHPSRPLKLVYSRDDVAVPRYDLALLAPQVMGAEAREISAAAAEEGSAGPVTSLVSPRVFWVGLVVAVVVLGGLIVRLTKA